MLFVCYKAKKMDKLFIENIVDNICQFDDLICQKLF